MVTDDMFSIDPLMTVLAQATGRAYPSRGAVQWADRLAQVYGEDMTIKALEKASADVEAHEVLTRAEQMLEYAAANGERLEDRDERRRHTEARDRAAQAELDRLKTMAQGTRDPRPLSEILPDLAERFGKDNDS